MGDDHRGAPVSTKDAAQQSSHRGRRGDIERRHGFVEQKNPRFGGKGSGDRDALRLAAGQLGGPPVGEVLGVHRLEPPAGDLACVGAAAALAPWRVGDIGDNAHVREQQRLLSKHRDAPGVRRDEHPCGGVGDHRVPEFDPAVVGAQQSGDERKECRFPCPVGAKNGQHVSVVEREVELCVALIHARPQAQPAHIGPARRRDAEAMTMTAATTIRSSESATAASGSVSRCR